VDYILFGAGTGASLAVIGWILREWGPRLRDGKSDDEVIYSASELIDRMSWARFCASCGMAMVVAGTLILLATAVVTAWNPGDELAARILIGMYLFVSVLMLIWAFLYTRQFGTGGIYRPAPLDPISDTREAVAVTERDSSASPSDAPSESDTDETPVAESPAESQPDFAEVAARRGGLGRFASFFNRQRPADTSNEDAEPEEAQRVIESDQPSGDGRKRSEIREDEVVAEIDGPNQDRDELVDIREVEAITETGGGEVELTDTVEIEETEETEEVTIVAPDAVVVEADPAATEGIADPPATQTEQGADDAPDVVSSEEPALVATPEDDALAELRRRRLERLSGGKS